MRELKDSKQLTIGALSRATRIPIDTLRTWERRYGSPMPVRKPSGHRLYSIATVEHLRRVGRLLAQGHRPGEILGLPLRELDSLISLSEPDGPRAPTGPEAASVEAHARSMAKVLRDVAAFDRDSLLGELRMSWIQLGPLRFLQDFAGPLMIEIGRAWHQKRLEVRHEHFASACLWDFLREVSDPFDRQARGPRVAAATLPGEAHEGGLLMASALLAYRGYRVIYLGADTPIDQIAAAASDVEAVVVSISAAMPRARAAKAIDQLRKALPHRMPLWVGGAGAPSASKGVERFETLDALDARVAP